MISEYPICPVPKPRMTRRDKWLSPPRPKVQRYRQFCLQCKLEKVVLPAYGSHVTFVLPMPKTWSKKKKVAHDGQAHMDTPDLDNLTKAILDACYSDDSGIHDIWVTKKWGYEGKIVIEM